jgi:hypothetical protein
MRPPRMTTRRWMAFVALAAAALAALAVLRRMTDAKVAGFMQQIRERMGLPPEADLSDFNVPVTREVIRWIDFDHFLRRFWLVLAVLVVLSALAATAWFPRGAGNAGTPAAEHNRR